MDALTYRDPCMVVGCTTIARSTYTVVGPVELPFPVAAPGRELKLCPRHEYELRTADLELWPNG
jgi:hypothetical protein